MDVVLVKEKYLIAHTLEDMPRDQLLRCASLMLNVLTEAAKQSVFSPYGSTDMRLTAWQYGAASQDEFENLLLLIAENRANKQAAKGYIPKAGLPPESFR